MSNATWTDPLNLVIPNGVLQNSSEVFYILDPDVGAKAGMRFRITRSGGGAFNLNIGTGPLKGLAADTWCEVVYDGSAWYLAAYGAL